MTSKASSYDGYVRIPISALPSVELRHLVSEKDLSIAALGEERSGVTITGYTEWVGSWQDLAVSVGWDWGVMQDVIVVLNPNEIRTNVQLISENCHPEQPMLARIHLLNWIESMPWRQIAIQGLLANDKDLGQ